MREKSSEAGLEHWIDNKCSISGFFAAMEALYLHRNNISVFHHLLSEVCACCLKVLWLVYAYISRKLWTFLGLLFLSSACDVVFLCCFFSQPWLLSSFSLAGFSLYFLTCRSPDWLQQCRSGVCSRLWEVAPTSLRHKPESCHYAGVIISWAACKDLTNS